MAKARKKDPAKVNPKDNGEPMRLKPIQKKLVTLRIKGMSPLIQHKWSEKALAQMRDKHAGKKTKTRDVRDPQAEGEAATYRTADGDYGLPVAALKNSLIGAAHKDIGIEKTLVRKALFIRCADTNGVLKMDCNKPKLVEDAVRVGQGSTDLRYRPYFYKWAVEVTFEVDAELLTMPDLLTLVDRAGFGVGVNERRPEKGGEYGRFCLDNSQPVTEEVIA